MISSQPTSQKKLKRQVSEALRIWLDVSNEWLDLKRRVEHDAESRAAQQALRDAEARLNVAAEAFEKVQLKLHPVAQDTRRSS